MWILTSTTQRFVQHNRDGNASPRWNKNRKTNLAPHIKEILKFVLLKPHVILCSELVGGECHLSVSNMVVFFLDIIIISHPPIILLCQLIFGMFQPLLFFFVNVFLYSATFIRNLSHCIWGAQQPIAFWGRNSVVRSVTEPKSAAKKGRKIGPSCNAPDGLPSKRAPEMDEKIMEQWCVCVCVCVG